MSTKQCAALVASLAAGLATGDCGWAIMIAANLEVRRVRAAWPRRRNLVTFRWGVMAVTDFAVQRVRVTWTKRSRGLPQAALRNAAPFAFELPSAEQPLFHDVEIDEQHHFIPRDSFTREPPPRELGIRRTKEGLRIQVPAPRGLPRRPHPAFTLMPGEWLRWQVNYRACVSYTGFGDWCYGLTTINVAVGPVPRDVFLGEPPHLIDERGSLS